MKFGIRKPSLKRSIKARTTGKIKRRIKKALIPGYGKKGAGWIKNPKKALYNKVYNKSTISVSDLIKYNFRSNSKAKDKINISKESEFMDDKVKVPFYKKTWFIVLISIVFPVVGIIFIWKSKKSWNKIVKIILTVVASFWTIILLAGVFGGEGGDEKTSSEVTSQAIVKEETTTAQENEEKSTINSSANEQTSTEESTKEYSTDKPSVSEKITTKSTTTKPNTTNKVVTTKPTTTKKQSSDSANTDADYIINVNSDIFHEPSCPSVKKMKEENKKTFKGTRDEAIDKGYKPCGNCHP